MAKDTAGKLRYDLLPHDALEAAAAVVTFGLGKYGERDWEIGIPYGDLYAAAQRHLSAWWRGEEYDPESGLPHLAHAAVNVLFLLAYSMRVEDGDEGIAIDFDNRSEDECPPRSYRGPCGNANCPQTGLSAKPSAGNPTVLPGLTPICVDPRASGETERGTDSPIPAE